VDHELRVCAAAQFVQVHANAFSVWVHTERDESVKGKETVHPLFKHGSTDSDSQTECFNTMPLNTKPNFCISLEVS
jgi:hypothetical protein